MFTRDSVIISHNIKTPLTSISRAVGNILQLTYGQLVKSLFSNGEQGFVYDPNDLSTMYQDAAGTVPVTAAGQPVGLMLDKSKALALGGERWDHALTAASGQSSKLGANRYRIYSADGVPSQVSCGTGTRGNWYEITFTIESIVSGAVTTDFINTPTWNSTGVKKFKGFLLSPAITFKRAGFADAVISNISVKEISGNHAFQTTSASRPILRKNAVTGANYLEFDGSDDFLQTNNIDFTATDKVSLFAGVRKLSDAQVGILAEFSAVAVSNNGAFAFYAPPGAATRSVTFVSRGTVNGISSYTNPQVIAPVSVVMCGIGSVSTDTSLLRVNGAEVVATTTDQGTGNYGNYPLYIGRRAGTSNPFNGHIYSLIGVGRLSTESETVAIEKELAKRVGVTLNV